MAEQYIRKIRTESGDLQIDYTALANLPQSDTTLKQPGAFADAAEVGDQIFTIMDLFVDFWNSMNETNAKVDQLEATVGALGGDLGDLGNQGFITESVVDNKLANYVKNTDKASSSSAGVMQVGTGLTASNGVVSVASEYVTETELNAKGYLTGMPIATTSTYGAVKPSSDQFYIDNNGYLKRYGISLEGLSGVMVSSTMPSNPIDGFWYLIPWGGDG